jgi:nucleotide-binding universal stress UspA family protein
MPVVDRGRYKVHVRTLTNVGAAHAPIAIHIHRQMEAIMKNILLFVHEDVGQEARLQAALDITRAVDGHLTCLDMIMFPALAGSDVWGTAGAAMVVAEERTIETENRLRLEKRLAIEGVQWTWINAIDDVPTQLERTAVLNELIVLNRHIEGFAFPDMRAIASDAIVRSGKPVLAVPEIVTGFAATGSVLIAWDGSRQADAALQAALPLLKLASEATLLEVGNGSVRVPAEDAASLLSRHGIHANIIRISKSARRVADVLLEQIAARKPAYVVMGGFGHSRLGEALFGGVTRVLLTKSPVPLLLAH